MKVQVKREMTNDPDVRMYSSRALLTQVPAEMAMRGQQDVSDIMSAILEIPGVGFAQVFPYHIAVGKVPQFTWEEIEVSVLRLFAALNLDLESLSGSSGVNGVAV